MPNRIIKESICTSEQISELTDFQFRLWVGLITQADDAGRGDARPAIIKGRVFPLRDGVTVKQIEQALYALATIRLIDLYEVGGKLFYWFSSWAAHQRVRDCKPKYPAPEEGTSVLPPSAASCGKPPQAAALIQSESNPNPNPNPNPIQRAREAADVEFEAFWNSYPRKVGKQAAKRAFDKVSVPVKTLVTAVERQKCSAQWRKENGRYIPNPATWLNQGRWEDEVAVTTGNVFADLAMGGDLL